MLLSGITGALRPPQPLQTTPPPAPPPEPVSQTSGSTAGSTTDTTLSQSAPQPSPVPAAAAPAPRPEVAPPIVPVATRQSAELVETMLRLDAPREDAAPDAEFELDQARAMALAAQSRWRDAQLIDAIQPAAPAEVEATAVEPAQSEPSLAAKAATTAPVEPRLMMTV